MDAMTYTPSERRLSLGAVMAYMLGIGLTLGLTFPLTSLPREVRGAPGWIIGLAAARSRRANIPISALILAPRSRLVVRVGEAFDRYGSLTRMSGDARFALALSAAAEGRTLVRVAENATGRVILLRVVEREAGLAARLAALTASPLSGKIARILFAASDATPVAELTPLECYLLSYQLQGNQNNDRTARRSETCLAGLIVRDPRDPRDAWPLALQGALFAQ